MDRYAVRWAGAGLSVPEVLEIGDLDDGHFAVSRFVSGTPLEQVAPREWDALVPAIVDAFERMRVTPIDVEGFGPWSPRGAAPFGTWKQYLLAVGTDAPSMRTHGWSTKLERHDAGSVTMRDGLTLLAETDLAGVPRAVVHADLMNRNVHVVGDRIAGVFDWGCSVIGDHVYELAGPEFYAPHHSSLDIAGLTRALEARWSAEGLDLSDLAVRRMAAHLHVGLVHVAYNAFLEHWEALDATVARTRELVPDLR
jgi:hypothetical protein